MKALLLSAMLFMALLATPAAASLTYHGVETTINDDLSAAVKVTLKFSGDESRLEYRTSLPASNLKTGGTFGPVACNTEPEGMGGLITCSLSGISADKNTLSLDFTMKGAANYSYGRYYFGEGFAVSLPADKFFSLVKLPESATLAVSPPENSYSPSSGTTITDGKSIMVIWEGGNISANSMLDFRVEYNLPPIRGSVTRYILIGAGVMVLVVVAIALLYIRRASRINKGRVIASVLNSDEKRVVDIVAAGGDNALQKQVVRESGFSKAKVSRLVKSLSGRGIIKVEPVSGRENRLLLANEKASEGAKPRVDDEKEPEKA
jgi:uncharacterized membrane protein